MLKLTFRTSTKKFRIYPSKESRYVLLW